MDDRILKMLYEPLKLSERRGVGNKVFKYVPSEDIVDRMNRVFLGSWSTEVRDKEIIEDQILVCIRVYVTDPIDNSKQYWHDGYASHPIARYTSGQNNGKAIDIGNAFKSAMSKAIKTAVSKWGVALYLEGGDTDSASSSSFGVPDIGPAAQKPGPVSTEKPAEVMPDIPTFTLPAETKVEKKEEPAPVSTGSPFDIPLGGVGTPTGNNQDIGLPSSPFTTVENTETPVDVSFAPVGEENGEFCTAVQQVAINTIMESHSLTFNDLLIKALKRESDLPGASDKLKYMDAVKVIQFGNELSKV